MAAPLEPMNSQLVDIQIDNGVGQESLLSIETNSVKDDAIAIGLYLVVVISTALAGIFGPSQYISDWNRFSLVSTQSLSLQQDIPSIRPINRNLILYLEFSHSSSPNITNVPLNFSYLVIFRKDAQEIRRESGGYKGKITFGSGAQNSKPLIFLSDHLIDYDEAHVSIDFEEAKDMVDCLLSWKYSDPTHSYFQIWVRFIFAVASLATTSLFVYRLHTNSFKNWYYEQKLSVILHIFAVIGSNPFYALLVFHPSILQTVVNSILFNSFIAFTAFFLLAIFDNSRKKIPTRGALFYAPKAALSILLFISGILKEITDLDVIKLGDIVSPHPLQGVAQLMENGSDLIFVVYFIALCVLSLLNVDPTEKHKVIVYISVFGTLILFTAVSKVFGMISAVSETSGQFALTFSSLYAFVIIIAFFHWPYEASLDQQYNDTTGQNKTPEEFFGVEPEAPAEAAVPEE